MYVTETERVRSRQKHLPSRPGDALHFIDQQSPHGGTGHEFEHGDADHQVEMITREWESVVRPSLNEHNFVRVEPVAAGTSFSSA
jgi:hypothetical protein